MSNTRLELVQPAAEYETQVMEFRAEMLASGDSFDGCAGLENEVPDTAGLMRDYSEVPDKR